MATPVRTSGRKPHKRTEHVKVPGIYLHRPRSNSLPQAPPFLLQPQVLRPDMAQRSAVSRAKLEKISAHSASDLPKPGSGNRRPSSSFSSLFTFTNTATAPVISRPYRLTPEGSLSNSSLPFSQASTTKGTETTPFQQAGYEGLKKLVVAPTTATEDLQRIQGEHATLLAENAALLTRNTELLTRNTELSASNAGLHAKNAELLASQEAEKGFSVKLLLMLQQYHESQGRVNPDPGNLNSVYYRDLKDEHGNSLVRPEMEEAEATPLLGDLADDCYSDEEEYKRGEKLARRRAMMRSFENQRV